MLGLKKPNFRTEIIHFEISHNAENCNKHSVAKFQKKLKGNPLESLKNFRKKTKKNENFQQSHSAEKSERRDPLGFFNSRSVAKYQNKLKGGPFEDI